MSKLLSPITIGNTTFKNRITISPMCQYSAVGGFATDWHLVHLGSRAVGGAGLVMQEATAISREGRISYGDLGIWEEEQCVKLQQIVAFLHGQGAKAGIQLAHAGRKASCEVPWKGGQQIPSNAADGWQTFSASALPFKEGQEAPLALDQAGIQQVISDFTAAATRAIRAGYDVIEIHAAHGYLLHQFYSPLSNQRTDEYGGSFDNRVRLVVAVVHAVRQVWEKGKPLFVRISSTDWTEGGWTIEDSVKLALILKEAGADLIDASSGGNVAAAKIPVAPGYQVGFAEQIKKQSGILTGAVGIITTPEQAEEILTNEQADLIFIARQSLRDPYFPLHAATALQDDIQWPLQYERAKLKP
ncbi:NADH:flavin oxidoreductase/NADH oxidase [Chitinophaga sp. GbtcB8]|uniref:NADH:flavin oxidoreductase/NADH oxidase n=1 Tax=Chitinophaga sp. GbtcB8 TaxID=2824753 RepID=UPI001C2F5D1F|nr:NADH:flavin oxidoreductase/NADH oxidase [Chitinophaga sp. GbtcB8]